MNVNQMVEGLQGLKQGPAEKGWPQRPQVHLTLTPAEFDAVLAGLRCLAEEMDAVYGLDESIACILTSADAHAGLTADEIARLGDRLTEPDLPEYLVVYEHLQGTDIFRIRSQNLAGTSARTPLRIVTP